MGGWGTQEVTLSRETLDGILNDNRYFGSTVGRVANRVANAVFKVDDKVGCTCLREHE